MPPVRGCVVFDECPLKHAGDIFRGMDGWMFDVFRD